MHVDNNHPSVFFALSIAFMRLPAHHPPSTFIIQSSLGYTRTLKNYHKGKKNEVENNISGYVDYTYHGGQRTHTSLKFY